MSNLKLYSVEPNSNLYQQISSGNFYGFVDTDFVQGIQVEEVDSLERAEGIIKGISMYSPDTITFLGTTLFPHVYIKEDISENEILEIRTFLDSGFSDFQTQTFPFYFHWMRDDDGNIVDIKVFDEVVELSTYLQKFNSSKIILSSTDIDRIMQNLSIYIALKNKLNGETF